VNRAVEAALRSLPEDRVPAIVAPLYWTGLGVVRALASHGVPVLALDPAPRQASAYTRRCQTILTEDGGDRLWETLYELGDALADRRPVLFFTTDHDAVRASAERAELARRFRFRFPEPEVFSLLVDKLEFADFANRHGLPVPRTFVIRGGEGWDEVRRYDRYPMVVKPKYRTSEWRAAGLEKVYKVGSRDDLEELLRLVRRFEGDYVVQEWIPGTDSELYFHVTYFGEEGEPLIGFTAHKLRQWPALVGSSSVTLPGPEEPSVAEQTVRLLKLAGLRGLGSAEFKRDRRDGRMKIMEPSVLRATLGGGVAVANGANLYYRAYCDLAGVEFEPEPAKPETRWVFVEGELMTFLKNPRGVRRQVSIYGSRRVYGDFAWTDPLPLLAGLVELSREALSRVFNVLRPRRRARLVAQGAPAEGGS
jgi:D-aspartate ligase